MTTVVRLAALAVAAVILVGGWLHLSADSDHDRLPRGFDSPILAIEMARSMAEVNAIVGGPGHRDRSVMRDQQHIDFAFIAAYWFLFLLIGVLLGRRRFPLAKALAFFSAACATLAAILDVRENLAILKVLSASPAPGNDALAQAVRASAVPKWVLLFVAMAVLSFAFLGRKDWRSRSSVILMFPGLLFLLTSAVGLLSLLTRESMLELTQVPMLIGLVALLLALWGAQSRLVEGI